MGSCPAVSSLKALVGVPQWLFKLAAILTHVKKAAKAISRRSREPMEKKRSSLTNKGEKMYSGESTGVAFTVGTGKNRLAYLPGVDSAPPGIDDPGHWE